MKLIKIVAIGIIIFFFLQTTDSNAQRVALNRLTIVQIPSTAKQLSSDQTIAWLGDNFIGNHIVKSLDGRQAKNGVFYQSRNILICLFPNEKLIHTKPSYLKDYKVGLGATADRVDSNYYSEIKKINSNEVLLTHLTLSNLEKYIFMVINSAGTRELGGEIYFHHKDAKEAKIELNRFLSSVKLKGN